jgi:glutamate/aspartate transport system permease protein
MEFLNYSFDWSVLWQAPYGSMLIKGLLATIHLSLLSWVIAVILGIMIGIFRVLPQPWIRFMGSTYVQIFRNTPFLVQLFFWYFAAPLLLPREAQEWLYDHVSDYSYWAGVAALGTYTASRLA